MSESTEQEWQPAILHPVHDRSLLPKGWYESRKRIQETLGLEPFEGSIPRRALVRPEVPGSTKPWRNMGCDSDQFFTVKDEPPYLLYCSCECSTD